MQYFKINNSKYTRKNAKITKLTQEEAHHYLNHTLGMDLEASEMSK